MKKKWSAMSLFFISIGLLLLPNITATTETENIDNPSITASLTSTNPGTLSGYVTDSAMNPIEGAKVRVSFHDTYRENYSDTTGYYHITDIPLCNCTKNTTCFKQGYQFVWVYLSIWEESTYDFMLPSKGNWWYVGGSGPGNYSRIQDAIDNATAGDTVYVYPGDYKEHIEINRSIRLQGANSDTTIIDGESTNNDLITCVGTEVFISGFTLHNCSPSYSGVLINHTTNCTVYRTTISTTGYGIRIRNAQNISIVHNMLLQTLKNTTGYVAIKIITSRFCTVSQNNISSWEGGILLHGTHLLITQNTIMNTYRGITDTLNSLPFLTKYVSIDKNQLKQNKESIAFLGSTDFSITRNEITNSTVLGINVKEDTYTMVRLQNVSIRDNIISDSAQGIVSENSLNMTIEGNHILRNTLGLSFLYDSSTSVKNNTFQDNTRTVVYQWAFLPFAPYKNKVPQFDLNFWDHPRKIPYPVLGRWGISAPYFIFRPLNIFLWVTFDWHPANEPYDFLRQ
jgi:parallel beta-helix repeat protein